jgi:hypothetical protein
MGGRQEDEKEKCTSLHQPLLNSQAGPRELIQADAETIPEDGDKCPQDVTALGRNQDKIKVPTVIGKGTGRMNVPNGPATPKGPPD